MAANATSSAASNASCTLRDHRTSTIDVELMYAACECRELQLPNTGQPAIYATVESVPGLIVQGPVAQWRRITPAHTESPLNYDLASPHGKCVPDGHKVPPTWEEGIVTSRKLWDTLRTRAAKRDADGSDDGAASCRTTVYCRLGLPAAQSSKSLGSRYLLPSSSRVEVRNETYQISNIYSYAIG
ncbi:hypothetical protein PHYSODRAFT_301668 [Phytophthora sojae]|uniref:Uncharacterized protein n=1 Tax=Phytophthora sojae (strain P6497) TaxID=1094619 RepID=G4ZKX0_PHYSP|nr:hypothetical protein PHYSODRAFT_301668 [Phytophthora sojae]EGZ14888.1 hypothetical protein PHYSODRAFT_301668 [Phytophthora sojae]|eukprot:XP_009528637.1 hypothetical protein PHYSODRAFT_301668 [Phytophthora sojae]